MPGGRHKEYAHTADPTRLPDQYDLGALGTTRSAELKTLLLEAAELIRPTCGSKDGCTPCRRKRAARAKIAAVTGVNLR
jgi:hypothetical protein